MAASSTVGQPRNHIPFAKLRESLQAPDPLGLQVESFDWLLGNDAWKAHAEAVKAEGRIDVPDVSGLEEIPEEIPPVEDLAQAMSLSFRDYRLERLNYSVEEAKVRNYTYSAPMYVAAEFINHEIGEIKGQTMFMGGFPLMTPRGTFIINGTEHVVVLRLVYSPGVYFERVSDRSSDRNVSGARTISSRGARLEFGIDKRNAVGVHIDREHKQPTTHFLKVIDLMEAGIREKLADYPVLLETLEKDTVHTQKRTLLGVYCKLRPNGPANVDPAQILLNNFHLDNRCCDLVKVGRCRINKKLTIDADSKASTLSIEDVVTAVKYLLVLRKGEKTFAGFRNGEPIEVRVESGDINHFGNRRIRAVGELTQAQVRSGLARIERTIRERTTAQERDSITSQTLINIHPVVAAIKGFFGTSQLSQFMDQNSPLADLTRKRHLSVLGPGGLSRGRTDMEVHGVHPPHYGRMCPIGSPGGPSIGLIGSFTTFVHINLFGFTETSYRIVHNGRVTNEVEYLIADDGNGHFIAQASSAPNEDGIFTEEHVLCRVAGKDPALITRDRVDYMDVSVRQMVSVAAAFIPSPEHDGTNRALMGANIQCQAVPPLTTKASLVDTGVERCTAKNLSEMAIAANSSVITEVSADLIIVSRDEGGTDIRCLEEFERSNPGNYMNQRVVTDKGDRVEAGVVLVDGLATDNDEAILDKNLLVAYMSWEGPNYEDAIILSRRVVGEDVLTPIHIEEHEVSARETELGEEETIRDIPNASEKTPADLDERGIICIGTEVAAGGILVGEVTPKGKTRPTSEERLLRATFGKKAREVRSIPLRVPYDQEGIIVGVREFSDEEDDLNPGVRQTARVCITQCRKITIDDKVVGRHSNKGVVSKILPVGDIPFLGDGTPVDIIPNPLGVPGRMDIGQVLEYHLGWPAHQDRDASKTVGVGGSRTRDLPAEGITTQPQTLVVTPVFDGLEIGELAGLLRNVNPNRDSERLASEQGKARLFDGRSDEPLPYPIAVGYAYMLKLHRLVDDKIHVRSTGPYPMITQQPLGSKVQLDGQRFGKVEVWAPKAYGAAYALQKLLTIKSDDTTDRVKVYEATVKGEDIPEPGTSEPFRVFIQEMCSLCLNVETLDAAGNTTDLHDQEGDLGAREDLGITPEVRPNAISIIDAI